MEREDSYRGVLDDNGFFDQVLAPSGKALDPRLDLRNHSPTGFAWGYGGSGPAQLALAILADALGDDERALRLYQAFKFEVIATLPQNEPFLLPVETVLSAVASIENTMAA